jgi:hypothetical protein
VARLGTMARCDWPGISSSSTNKKHTDSSATHLDRPLILVLDRVQKRLGTVGPLLHRLLRICSLRRAVVCDSAAVKTQSRRTAFHPIAGFGAFTLHPGS